MFGNCEEKVKCISSPQEKKHFGEISQDTINQIDLEKKDQWSL